MLRRIAWLPYIVTEGEKIGFEVLQSLHINYINIEQCSMPITLGIEHGCFFAEKIINNYDSRV